MKAQENQNIKISLQRALIRQTKKSKYVFLFLLFLIPNLTQAQLTFQHWQTFQQSKAFDLQLNLNQNLSFDYKASETANPFTPKKVVDFSSFVERQTPGYLDFHELGWFCTLDLKLDLTMRLPLRFRLGNLDYVNRKEGYYD